jgi:hypothetical protein
VVTREPSGTDPADPAKSHAISMGSQSHPHRPVSRAGISIQVSADRVHGRSRCNIPFRARERRQREELPDCEVVADARRFSLR